MSFDDEWVQWWSMYMIDRANLVPVTGDLVQVMSRNN